MRGQWHFRPAFANAHEAFANARENFDNSLQLLRALAEKSRAVAVGIGDSFVGIDVISCMYVGM